MKPCTAFDNTYLRLLEKCSTRVCEIDKHTDAKYKSMGATSFEFQGLPLLTLKNIEIKFSFVETVYLMAGLRGIFFSDFGFDAEFKKFESIDYVSPKRYIDPTSERLIRLANFIESKPTHKHATLSIFSIGNEEGDEPNTTIIQFTSVRGCLDMSVMQGSTDILCKLPHEIITICFIWYLIAARLDLQTGSCSWCIGNAYLFNRHMPNVDQIITEGYSRAGECPNFNILLNKKDFTRALEGKESLIHDVYQQLQPAYDRLKSKTIHLVRKP